ncbi:FecR domain-containing protein [Corallococcus sp. AS-1-12]|uniref:FecR domain-containing protein n=1 Tax=Corallococcus sp. AS-1-12 TaxID=2874598 RepID=UPI001CBF7FB3|nr:FecR domain-containing protein [Corallococcus sp. AS-1-12]MBZ4333363.1 FecR domain-containing protein [Corallococcus sp. AS-1-12]
MAAPPSRRRQAPFLAGLVLILAALPVGWFVFLREPPAPLPPPEPPRAAAPVEVKKAVELVLSSFEGTVEVKHGEAGAWEPARKDMPLRPTDVVRTGRGSWAVVLNGESVELRMEADTEISVEEISNELSKVMLGSGLATATVRGRPNVRHTFILKAKNGDAEASTSQGTFTMSNNGKGTVSVGTREGDVKLTGKEGRFVIVRAGQQSIVRPGKAPTEPAPIPSSVFLKMQWPKGRTQRTQEVAISGSTVPGSRVTVNGASVLTDEEGNFKLGVPLEKGKNTVHVSAVGVGGARQEEQRELVLDTPPPKKPGTLKVDTNVFQERVGGTSP